MFQTPQTRGIETRGSHLRILTTRKRKISTPPLTDFNKSKMRLPNPSDGWKTSMKPVGMLDSFKDHPLVSTRVTISQPESRPSLARLDASSTFHVRVYIASHGIRSKSQPSTVEPTKCLDVFSLELTKKKGGNSSFTSSRISPCFEPEKQMDGADIGSAAIGAVFGSVLEIVKEVAITTYHFKSKLNLIEKRLISIKPKIDLIAKSNLDLNRSDDTKMFIDQLKAGEKLVLKCSKIKPWELRRSVLTRLGSTPLPLGPIPFDDGV
ncbi:hypothetical protein LguiB_009205 [Lonicera macranthoides]